MPGMSIDGLVSGLNTTELVAQLMAVESIPQRQLQARVARTNDVVAALQGLNTRAASLAGSANELADPLTWQAVSTSSSNEAVSASATAGAATGSITLDVVKVATSHSVAGPEMVSPPVDPTAPGPTITITRGGAPLDPIQASSQDPADIAAAINDADIGITATAVQVRDGVFRVQLTADETGAAGDFTVAGLGTTSLIRQAQDAEISLGGDLVVTSSTNTFEDLLPGTTLTVSAEATNVTVGVARDDSSAASAVKDLVSNLNVLLGDIISKTRVPVEGSSAAGVLLGNSTVRSLAQSLLGATSGTVEAGSPSAAGLEITRDGKVELDEDAFAALLADDPARAQQIITGLAERVATVAHDASRSGDGRLSQLITNREGQIDEFTTRIEDWDRRLDVREATLKRTYSALEVALSNMQSQSNWLAGQLAGLPTWSGE